MTMHKRIFTQNGCYKAGQAIVPKGVMIHSTGANNPKLGRYVGPDDGLLGANSSGNHWNKPGLSVCVHAFVGKLKDGTITTYQTLPWTRRGWHCGRGNKGSGNDTHISFEICEDNLTDASYFHAVYQQAVELTAYLCKEYHLDPLEDGVVICHAEGHKRGIASNHADVNHWFPKFGKTMDDFRGDVAREIEGTELTEKEIRAIVREEYAAMDGEMANQPASDWAKTIIEEAKAKGITASGERPKSLLTREEGIAMALAAAMNKKEAEENDGMAIIYEKLGMCQGATTPPLKS